MIKPAGKYLLFLLLALPFAVAGQGQTNADLARQYASTGECDKAIVYFEKWYATDPYNSYKPYLSCLTELKEYDKAEKLIHKQIKKIPSNASLWVDMGNLSAAQGKTKDAENNYQKAIKSLFPDVQQVLNLGTTFSEARMYKYAEATYLRGRELTGDTYPYNFELADLYAQQSEYQKMIDEYLGLLEFNPNYLPNLQNVLQNKIAFDTKGDLSDVIRTSLLRKIQKEPSKTMYSELLYWLFLQEKDFDSALIQAKALEKRTGENGGRILSLGKLALANNEYATAEACFRHVIGLGKENPNFIEARIKVVEAVSQDMTSKGSYKKEELLKLEKDYDDAFAELGRNYVTAPLLSSYAHLEAFYLDNTTTAIDLLNEAIEMPRISPLFQAECKLELGDILILVGEVWESSLLYSQVDKDFKNDAIGREAKFRNARLSYFMGEFEWAAAQLNVLKAATSQLISNDALALSLLIMDNTGLDSSTDALLMYSRADLYAFTNRNDAALATMDSLLILFPGHSLTDEVWNKEASIYYKKGDYVKAASLYQKITETYPDDILGDDALFHLAEIYETKLNDKTQAQSLYETFLEKYPGSLYVSDARKRFRALRGDTVN
ncbi:MAG TPA: tetratricopeptide repeat protein [Bacteroidia bacterium]|nr:tetratricopeptide repeat protein [Bacteroidia bacterium]